MTDLGGTSRVTPEASGVEPQGLPPGLHDELRGGGRTLLCSRYSTAGGRRARDMAVRGIYAAASMLALRHRWDLTALLPERSELLTLLELQAEVVTSESRDGRRFKNFSLEYTARAKDGLVLLVQYGSGSIRDVSYHQPAIDRVARCLRTWCPALLYANETRAYGRADFALAPLAFALEEVSYRRGRPVHIGAVTKPIRPLSNVVLAELFADGQRAKEEAEGITVRTRIGWRERTGEGKFVGRFPHARPGALPPPLDATVLKAADGGPGDRIGYVDTPGARPSPDEVDGDLPGAFESRTLEDGTRIVVPVDQLALVRWAYENAYQPNWPSRPSADYLVAHGYSPMGSRQQHPKDPAAHPALRPPSEGSSDPSRLLNGIFDHAKFHLTGRLVFDMGDGLPAKVLTLLMPDLRPICTKEQYDRITTYRKRIRSRRARRLVHTMTGLSVLIDHVPAILVPAHHTPTPAFAYQRVLPDRPGARSRYSPAPALRLQSVLEAVCGALKGHPALWPAAGPSGDERDLLESAVAVARLNREAAAAKVAGAEKAVKNPGNSVRAAKVCSKELDQVVEAETLSEAALAQAQADLDAYDHPGRQRGVELTGLFTFLCAWRRPHDAWLRAVLLRDVTDFVITTHATPGRMQHRRTVRPCVTSWSRSCGGGGHPNRPPAG